MLTPIWCPLLKSVCDRKQTQSDYSRQDTGNSNYWRNSVLLFWPASRVFVLIVFLFCCLVFFAVYLRLQILIFCVGTLSKKWVEVLSVVCSKNSKFFTFYPHHSSIYFMWNIVRFSNFQTVFIFLFFFCSDAAPKAKPTTFHCSKKFQYAVTFPAFSAGKSWRYGKKEENEEIGDRRGCERQEKMLRAREKVAVRKEDERGTRREKPEMGKSQTKTGRQMIPLQDLICVFIQCSDKLQYHFPLWNQVFRVEFGRFKTLDMLSSF